MIIICRKYKIQINIASGCYCISCYKNHIYMKNVIILNVYFQHSLILHILYDLLLIVN